MTYDLRWAKLPLVLDAVSQGMRTPFEKVVAAYQKGMKILDEEGALGRQRDRRAKRRTPPQPTA